MCHRTANPLGKDSCPVQTYVLSQAVVSHRFLKLPSFLIKFLTEGKRDELVFEFCSYPAPFKAFMWQNEGAHHDYQH